MNYRKVWTDVWGPIPKDEKGRSYEIHHIDGNRENNNLENLMCLSIKEHFEKHLEQGDIAAAHRIGQRLELDPEYLRKLNKEKSLGKKRPKEVCEKISRGLTGRKRSKAEKLSISKGKKGKSNGHEGLKYSDETRKKQSEASKHKCLHVESGQVFDSVSAASKAFEYCYSTFYLRFRKGEFQKLRHI